jgi:hypothetical protein
VISVAIAEVTEYAHLSDADVETIALSLEQIRSDIEASLGSKDRAYIKRAIRFQRCLEVAARLTIFGSTGKTGWAVGTLALLASKCIENMELGHNITHGQWDWMNDPEIHSNTWEWDMAGPSSQWRYSHNYRHHVFANVIGMDDDLGFGVIRVSRDQEWKPGYLWAPLRAVGLSIVFEWGIALHDLAAEQRDQQTDEAKAELKRAMFRKMGPPGRQGLSLLSGAQRTSLSPDVLGESRRRRFPQRVGLHRDRLRALRRWCREIHSRGRRERDEAGMVSAADAGYRELQRGPRPEVHEWKPLPPNRAPPVPRSAEQQVPRDRGASPGNPG